MVIFWSRLRLRMRAAVLCQHDEYLRVCRAVLSGPDTPGRRSLISRLRGDPAGPPESIGSLLIDEFSTLLFGKDIPDE